MKTKFNVSFQDVESDFNAVTQKDLVTRANNNRNVTQELLETQAALDLGAAWEMHGALPAACNLTKLLEA